MCRQQSPTVHRARVTAGVAVIDVPEKFRLVTELKGLTVQVTRLGALATLEVQSKSLGRIVVIGSADVEFDYFVNGVRRGFAECQPFHVNEGFVPQYRGVPYGMQYPEALRQILVANGILNADWTPNEATAERLGWRLKDAREDPAWHGDTSQAETRPTSIGATVGQEERR